MSQHRDDDIPLLDTGVLCDLRKLDNNQGLFLNELIEIFEHDSYPVLERLAKAIQSESSIEAMRLAHKFKGMGANLGILRLCRILEHIELDFPTMTLERQATLEERIRKEHEAALFALRSDWFAKARAS